MPGLLLSRCLPERRLARSVAHRLKYYIDVQRKEDSFDSSGVISDVDKGLHSNFTCLSEREDNKEHNFAKIKLEASLRAYVGSAEECNRKVQKSPEKQKDLEKLIKRMARDYVPDRTKEGKAKSTKRQRKLHISATPSMSPEDVRRLVSSASKLIVAATSEASPEELETTQGNGSSPKRREAKSIRSLDKGSKKPWVSSTRSHRDEARRAQQNQEGKNAKDVKKSTKPSNISSNSAKSKSFSTAPLPKPTDSSVNINSRAPYLQTGQNEVIRKGILKSRASPSCTSSAISGLQDKLPSVQRKNFSPCQRNAENSARHSYRPFKIKKQAASSNPAEMVSGKSCRPRKGLDTRPTLRSGNNQEVKVNSATYSTKSTAEVTSTQRSMGREKARKQYNSTTVSRGPKLKGRGHPVRDQGGQKSTFVENIGRRRMQENENVGCGSGSTRDPECHRVHFQKLPQGYIRAIADRGCHCLESCSLHNLRGPEETTLSSATVDPPTGLTACVEGDYSDDRIPMVMCGSSFLYDVCQEMDQGAPAGLTNRAVTIDGNGVDPSTGPLLNQRFSSNEPEDSCAVEEPANSWQKQGVLLGESCGRKVIHIPPMTPDDCRCSGLHNYCECGGAEEPSSESSATSESEQSEEEFTISSASGSSSARSLSSQHEQTSGNGKEEDCSNSGTEVVLQKGLKVMPENSTTWKETFYQHSEKQRSPDEKRTDPDHGTKGICTSQIVYFSHFPKSI